jgi:hypothetical protein
MEEPDDTGEPKRPRVLMGFMLVFFAAAVLCLLAAMVILTLQSRRFGIDLPWFDAALSALAKLVVLLAAATMVFKLMVQLWE